MSSTLRHQSPTHGVRPSLQAQFAGSLGLLISLLFASSAAQAQMAVAPQTTAQIFAPIAFVSPANFASYFVAQAQRQAAIRNFCTTLADRYRRFGWHDDPCGNVKWKADLKSRGGHPLLYAEYGNGPETTIILGGVHPDELTPMHLAFRMGRFLDEHPDVIGPTSRVILAPLVNPDGFLKDRPTRANGNGVDLNRNFLTMDWYDKAHRNWVERRLRQFAHFPGYVPNSEVETLFQIQLIDRFQPDKILSIHAPLGFLDYDGPGSGFPRALNATEAKAKRIVKAISESSQNYKVVDYEFYPGSLGNYAGNERHIPTVTLELQTTEPSKVEAYWRQFQPGILQSIHYRYTRAPARELTGKGTSGDDASPLSAAYDFALGRTI